MSDQVSKSMTKVAWILISIIGIVVAIGFVWGGVTFFVVPGLPGWIKLLVAVGLLGVGLLCVVVIRDRIKEHKTDKYKDVEV